MSVADWTAPLGEPVQACSARAIFLALVAAAACATLLAAAAFHAAADDPACEAMWQATTRSA